MIEITKAQEKYRSNFTWWIYWTFNNTNDEKMACCLIHFDFNIKVDVTIWNKACNYKRLYFPRVYLYHKLNVNMETVHLKRYVCYLLLLQKGQNLSPSAQMKGGTTSTQLMGICSCAAQDIMSGNASRSSPPFMGLDLIIHCNLFMFSTVLIEIHAQNPSHEHCLCVMLFIVFWFCYISVFLIAYVFFVELIWRHERFQADLCAVKGSQLGAFGP